jgi:hypothetical protein
MAFNPNIFANNQRELEYNKFVEINNDSLFPPVTANVQSYDDNKFETYVYNKKAILTYDAGTAQTNGSPFGDNSSIDAFGRLRVSGLATLLDSKFLHGKLPQTWDEQTLDGECVWVQNDSLVVMSTSANDGYVIRQTPIHFNYQPGKSTLVFATGVLAPQTNIIKRVGMFQGLSAAPFLPNDGMYLEVTSNGASFNVVKQSGTINTITIPQSAWNIDPLNGAGSSGLTIDFNKGQIFTMDYEWLGLGRIRFGFVLNGKIYYAHTINNFNALTSPYITSPNQPVRYEIRQVGEGSGTMKQICSTVMVEGGEDNVGSALTVELSSNVSIATNYTPVIAVRVNPNFHDVVSKIQQVDFINTGNNDVEYKVVVGPLVSVPFSWNQSGTSGYSPVEYAQGTGTQTISGGFSIYSNFVSRGTSAGGTGSGDIIGNLGRLGVKINGDPIPLVVVAKGLAGSTSVRCSLNMLIKA